MQELKDEIENLVDAGQLAEETLGEEDALKLFLGEALIAVDEEQAMSYIEQLKGEKKTALEEKQEKLREIDARLGELKTHLYAKFGNSINLEEQTD